MTELTFDQDGAQRFRCALSDSETTDVLSVLEHLPMDVAGIRLGDCSGLRPMLAASGPVGRIAAALIGEAAQPVRAVLFDKTAATNWSLAWHQDRTIVVRERRLTPEYGPWSTKAGRIHVQPPFRILEEMATLRLHLDEVDDDNAPLLIAPGSHREGRVPEHDIPGVVARLGTARCLAHKGDIWAYATPIIHASEVAASPRRRRVLQVDYSSRSLDSGLEWLGV